MRQFLLQAGFGLALLPTLSAPAWALDAQAVADRLSEVLDQQDIDFEFDTASADGDDIVLKDVTVGFDDDASTTYEQIVLEDVSEADDRYMIGRLEVPAKTIESEDEIKTSLTPAVFGDMSFGVKEDAETIGLQVGSVQMDSIVVSVPQGDFLTVENIDGSDLAFREDRVIEPRFSVERISFNTQLAPEDEEDREKGEAMRKQLADLGYSQIEASFDVTGTYDPSSGEMDFNETIVVEDALTLDVDGAFSNVTADLATKIQAVTKDMQKTDDDEQQMKFLQEKLLPLYEKIGVESATIRLEDNSLTDKVIGVMAERQNAQPEQLKLQAAMLAPALLASYVPAEFARQVSEALQTYLADPQSLTIELSPEDGTTVGQIIERAKSEPNTLTNLLGASVTANQD
ncbi:hypothetical protein [Notoacmeibacter ruber]|uniref:DUF945 family protein n=1 Tax=Notoacmeibacter ruber TaxID=2670375 RepID=A0A3L7JA15_9HYPH|nr:hypothetical protein [Notoacmeibacter ruber]RLQ87299.1 hypothetical protein D8780_02815 [Notoacmeibacter ruber]